MRFVEYKKDLGVELTGLEGTESPGSYQGEASLTGDFHSIL